MIYGILFLLGKKFMLFREIKRKTAFYNQKRAIFPTFEYVYLYISRDVSSYMIQKFDCSIQ